MNYNVYNKKASKYSGHTDLLMLSHAYMKMIQHHMYSLYNTSFALVLVNFELSKIKASQKLQS